MKTILKKGCPRGQYYQRLHRRAILLKVVEEGTIRRG